MTDIRNVHGISYTVRECPICGKNDKLVMPDYECFEELYNKNGRATMHMGCDRCNLQMYEYPERGKWLI